MLLLALICACCARCEDCGREMLAGNGGLKAGTPSLSYLRPSTAPLLPSDPQEANAEGSRARAVTYVPTASDPPGLYPFQRWAQVGLEEGSHPPEPRPPPLDEVLLRTLKQKP